MVRDLEKEANLLRGGLGGMMEAGVTAEGEKLGLPVGFPGMR